MVRTFFAAIFVLLALTAPVHAATVEQLDATINLDYLSIGELMGTIDLTLNPSYPGYHHMGENPYNLMANLSLNGIPLTQTPIGNTGYSETQDYFAGTGPLYDFEINTADITNLTPLDFFFGSGVDAAESITTGTVNVAFVSIAPTPLPAALPLFGAALAGLSGVGWIKRRRKGSA